MKFTKKFLDGYVTYDKPLFRANNIFTWCIKMIGCMIYGLGLGFFYILVIGGGLIGLISLLNWLVS